MKKSRSLIFSSSLICKNLNGHSVYSAVLCLIFSVFTNKNSEKLYLANSQISARYRIIQNQNSTVLVCHLESITIFFALFCTSWQFHQWYATLHYCISYQKDQICVRNICVPQLRWFCKHVLTSGGFLTQCSKKTVPLHGSVLFVQRKYLQCFS